jgi:hypothetical protein
MPPYPARRFHMVPSTTSENSVTRSTWMLRDVRKGK